MRLKMRDTWQHLICFPIIIGVIWLCAQLFPNDIRIADVGSLIVTGAVYFILVALLLLIVFMICVAMLRWSVAIVISGFCSLFAGMPVLLIMNEFVNGFWIGDAFVALVISIICSMLVIGYEYAISHRFH